MPRDVLSPPPTDPTPIFEHFRGSYGSELLTAAVAHLDLFRLLDREPLDADRLGRALGLADRPVVVLTTALRAMGLLDRDASGRFGLSELARTHLVPGGEFDVSGYVGLAAASPGVVEMVERLRTNRPAGADEPEHGAAFIYRDGLESAMDHADSARALTLALAGRARNVAPALVQAAPLGDARLLLDVGGGTGIYAIAYLQAHPNLRAIVWDRPEVLRVAAEFADAAGVADRLDLVPGDMFADPVPAGADAVLLSNILHDWDVPACRALLGRLAPALPPGGRLLVHDVTLDDDLSGPLPMALYSAALFTLTEGRVYSAGEFRAWLEAAGLVAGPVVPTAIHCRVLTARRP
jgi:ubiquinone/menaquinone biosynthesis C-methylase UbiE